LYISSRRNVLAFRVQVVRLLAVERRSGRSGVLTTFVDVRIRGNYRAGPVPVSVQYRAFFDYEEEWTDEWGNEIVATGKDFDTARERDAYVANFFVAASSKRGT
jgi:hypothetical protein